LNSHTVVTGFRRLSSSMPSGSTCASRSATETVEDLLAERGFDVSYETARSWVLKFGPVIARRLGQRRPRPSDRWHLDEMVVRIAGKRMYLWRAVDHEGEVLDMLVQSRRDSRAALAADAQASQKARVCAEIAGN
jgi:transposase-like protein